MTPIKWLKGPGGSLALYLFVKPIPFMEINHYFCFVILVRCG